MSIKLRPYKRRGVAVPGRWEAYLVVKRAGGEQIRKKLTVPDLHPGRPTSLTAAKEWTQQRYATLMSQGDIEATQEPQPVAKEERALTLSEFAPRFIEWAQTERHKPSEVESKQSIIDNHLKPVMGDKPLDQLTPLDLQALKAKLARRSQKTVNNVLAVLSKLLKVAVELGVIDTIPITAKGKKVDSPEKEFYEFDQYGDLCQAAESASKMHLALVLLGGDAGLRRGELIALEAQDVDFKRGVLSVLRSETRGKVTVPKGGRSRKVPLTSLLQATLEKVCGQRKSGRVLRREGGLLMTPETVKWWMSHLQREAKLEVTGGIHILRHTFCSHLAMKGAGPVDIQTLAGHRSLETTMRYMHLSPSHRATVIGLLDQRTRAALREEEKGSAQAEKRGLAATSPQNRGGDVAADHSA
jgi:integrase